MKVLVYPRDGNPYQELLYRPMRVDHRVRVTYLRRYGVLNVALLPIALVGWRLRGYRILHIHWPAFVVTLPILGGPRASYAFYRLVVLLASILRYRIVWTVHNVVPHQQETADDVAAARYLAAHCSAKIAHSSLTADSMARHQIDTSNLRIIPHGTYDGVYPSGIGRAAMRADLGVGDADTVFLAFGLIRPYKGVADLIRAFIEAQLPNAKLVLAGAISDPEVVALLSTSAHPDIVVRDRRIADTEVSDYFAAADCACFPLRRVTTSGSALLAVTFGVPVIARRVGDLALLPPNLGFFYEPDEDDGLTSALTRAFQARDDYERYRRAAREHAKSLSWNAISNETHAVYRALLDKDPV